MANRLIALDKCPGVRPIGIGECLRRVLGRVLALVTGWEAQSACGVDQLACGMQSGIEGAVHAMSALYDDHSNDGWGFLLMDAANAFNSVNRAAALWNARVLWPSCSRFLFNTYRGYAFLLLKTSNEMLLSREGMTQGDPLSMMFYSVATLPLVRALKGDSRWFQSWYADDSVCAGSLDDIRCWLDHLLELGPSYGYFPEPRKSYLVVAPNFTHLASDVFAGLGISIVSGHSFLGGVIGEAPQCADLMAAFASHYNLNGLIYRKWFATVGLCCSGSMMPLLLTFFQLCLILMFLSWKLPCFFYQPGWGDLAFVTQLNCVMLTLIFPLLE